MSSDFRGGSGEMCELLHTSPVVQKMMGTPVTAVTASGAGAWHPACAVAMEASSCSCRSGQALPPSSPITMGLPAPISPNDPLESRKPRPPWRGFQDHVYSLLAEGSPVLPHQRNPGTREMVPKWLDKKRPRRSGAKR